MTIPTMTIITYLQITSNSRPSCGQEAIVMAAAIALTEALFQAMHDSCGRLCSNNLL